MERITIELIPDLELGGFTARIPDIPAYGVGKTEDAAITDLKEAVQAYVADCNKMYTLPSMLSYHHSN